MCYDLVVCCVVSCLNIWWKLKYVIVFFMFEMKCFYGCMFGFVIYLNVSDMCILFWLSGVMWWCSLLLLNSMMLLLVICMEFGLLVMFGLCVCSL